jgi:hypothetical protein
MAEQKAKDSDAGMNALSGESKVLLCGKKGAAPRDGPAMESAPNRRPKFYRQQR